MANRPEYNKNQHDEPEMTMHFSDEPQFMEEQKGCSSLAVNIFLFCSGLLCVGATICGFWLFILSSTAKNGLGSLYLLGVAFSFFIVVLSLCSLIKVYKYVKD